MKTKILLPVAAIFVLASLAPPARAALLVHDGFNYTGDLIPPSGGAGQGTGVGWDGPWVSGLVVGGFPVIPTSLVPPTGCILPTGGSIQQTLPLYTGYHASRLVQQPLTINPGESLWFSAIVSTSAEPGSQAYVYFRFLAPGTPEMRFEQQPETSGGPLFWKFAGGSSSFGPLVAPNTPTLLVAEVHQDPVSTLFTFKYWVNPSPPLTADGLPTEPPVAVQTTIGGFSTLHYVGLASAGGTVTGVPTVHGYDELRIGSAYADINGCPPPTLTCPGVIEVQCDADVPLPFADAAAFVAAGGTVNGTAPVTVSSTGDVPSGSCPETITRTYIATDAFGGTATCSQIITVQDSTPPVISAAGADAPIECSATPVFTPPTATDNCDPTPLIVQVSDVTMYGACAGAATRTKTWHAVDACGNTSGTVSQTITVRDTTPPIIGTPGADTITECSATIVFTPPTATDNCDPAPVIVEELPDTPTPGACAGSYTLTRRWHAVDACGNVSATVSQTVTVRDTTPPVISAPGANATIECPATPTFTAPTATDNCDPTPMVVQESPDIITPGTCPGSYTLTKTWYAVDACGNVSATVSQTITVRDTTPPTIACPADRSVSTGPGPVTFSAVATDTCGPAPSVTFNPPSGSVFPLGTTTVYCSAEDACGNASTCSFLVTVTAPSGATSFTAASPIALRPGRSAGRADLYPSLINVAGLGGSIRRITVTLHGLSHSRPDDLDILLVGPGGETVRLMSDCGGAANIAGLELTFDDSAAVMIPNRGPITPGIGYKPTNYGRRDFFPAPAPRPGGGYGSALAVFSGLPADGNWSLFVRDDAARNTGAISGGWSLNITTE